MNTAQLERRRFLMAGGALVIAPSGLQSCASHINRDAYDGAVRNTWRTSATDSSEFAAIQRELVRCATLAPSSHNSQCWKFDFQEQGITILPDFTRRCPAVDPDDHHLFVSLGCAAENLVQAALAHGFFGEVVFKDSPSSQLKVALSPTAPASSPLYEAIAKRQCTRAEYDGQPLSNRELRQLEQAGRCKEVQVLLITDRPALETTLEYIVQGNTAQMRDEAFVDELKSWIRFDEAEAVLKGDGLFSGASGNRTVPRWLGSRLFKQFFTADGENDKYARQVRGSAGIAVFVSAANDKPHWVEAGRCYQRFALQATSLGIRTAFLNQPVEVASLRPQFASFLGIEELRPDLVVRFGRGPEMPRSLRRAIDEVLM